MWSRPRLKIYPINSIKESRSILLRSTEFYTHLMMILFSNTCSQSIQIRFALLPLVARSNDVLYSRHDVHRLIQYYSLPLFATNDHNHLQYYGHLQTSDHAPNYLMRRKIAPELRWWNFNSFSKSTKAVLLCYYFDYYWYYCHYLSSYHASHAPSGNLIPALPPHSFPTT